MCLIVFAWKIVPTTPLIVAANRDEFYARPTEPAHAWKESPHLFAGKDLQAGGTWMGIYTDPQNPSTTRFAALTNVRSPHNMKKDAISRGKLVSDYLNSTLSPQDYIAKIKKAAYKYNGFNLLVGNNQTLIWFSNCGYGRNNNGKPLAPGIYGLSNALLNDPWHKVIQSRAQFASLLGQHAPMDAYFEMLSDTTPAPDEYLPKTHFDFEKEKAFSSVCVVTPDYGTRCSTFIELFNDKSPTFCERIIR